MAALSAVFTAPLLRVRGAALRRREGRRRGRGRSQGGGRHHAAEELEDRRVLLRHRGRARRVHGAGGAVRRRHVAAALHPDHPRRHGGARLAFAARVRGRGGGTASSACSTACSSARRGRWCDTVLWRRRPRRRPSCWPCSASCTRSPCSPARCRPSSWARTVDLHGGARASGHRLREGHDHAAVHPLRLARRAFLARRSSRACRSATAWPPSPAPTRCSASAPARPPSWAPSCASPSWPCCCFSCASPSRASWSCSWPPPWARPSASEGPAEGQGRKRRRAGGRRRARRRAGSRGLGADRRGACRAQGRQGARGASPVRPPHRRSVAGNALRPLWISFEARRVMLE